MQTIEQILMTRDGLSQTEADEQMCDLQILADEIISDNEGNPIAAMIDLEDMLREEVGLEPDYVEELICKVGML